MIRRSLLVGGMTLGAVLATGGAARAALIDDFDSLGAGAVDGSNGWVADRAHASVGRDFGQAEENHVLRVSGANTELYKLHKPLGTLAIPEGGASTLHLRFLASSAAANHGLGLTDSAAPADWSAYRSTALIYNDGRGIKVQGRSGGSYVNLTLNGGAGGLATNTWYDLWMVVNNATDTTDYYLQGGAITERRLVGTGLPFRNGATSNPLQTFYARAAANMDAVLIDDVRIWSGGVDAEPANAARPAPTLQVAPLLDFAAQRLEATHNSLSSLTAYPSITAAGGAWSTSGASGWTSGFYPGMLWQMYRYTGDPVWRDRAAARTAGIEGQKINDGTHDLGFMIHDSFGQGYALTGDPAYRDVCLTAANTLALRYSPVVGAIQSWGNRTTGKYEVIIDNMMNLEMLFWAARNGGPASLYDLAVQHALTTREEHVRPDGGTYHVVEFDRATGAVITKRTHQGYSNDSTWSRGQAWGVYGFTLTYRETRDPRFLATAQLLADYFLDHLRPEDLAYYDFQDPANPPPWDSSAAAITASALLELRQYVGAADSQRYLDAAEDMLLALAQPAFLSDGSPFQSLLLQGTVAKTGANRVGTSYGDYYFLEALGRYQAIPEPASLAGLVGLGLLCLRRRR